jgi:SpoIIAA-like
MCGQSPLWKRATSCNSPKRWTPIEESGGLAGLIIQAPAFPGWESFGALAAHIRFVRDHHKQITRIGLVTDSAIGNVAEHLASHFVASEIKHFAASELEAARQWVMNRP